MNVCKVGAIVCCVKVFGVIFVYMYDDNVTADIKE